MRDVPGGAEHESETVRMFYEEGVMGVRTREKGYTDYGFSPGEEREIKNACRQPGFKTLTMLILACHKACPELALIIAFSLRYGLSYDKICYVYDIPLKRDSFYGYRRKALYHFKQLAKISF